MVARLRLVLPKGWFADEAPVLGALLTGLGTVWSGLYVLLAYVRTQTRIASASGIFLDMISLDFLGGRLPRRPAETDAAYQSRISVNLLAPRATRQGVVNILTSLTGRAPVIFEPLNATDTGGYNVNLGYNLAGGYGCNGLPYQVFVTAYRPNETTVSNAGGYRTGPGGYGTAPMYYADTTEFTGNVTDAEIYTAIAAALPVCAVAWTRISN